MNLNVVEYLRKNKAERSALTYTPVVMWVDIDFTLMRVRGRMSRAETLSLYG